jgi:hypothetical protein
MIDGRQSGNRHEKRRPNMEANETNKDERETVTDQAVLQSVAGGCITSCVIGTYDYWVQACFTDYTDCVTICSW